MLKSERTVRLNWERGRIFDKEVALLFLSMVKEQSKAKSVESNISEI